jgi:large subunit ribosomal protein L21
VRRALNVVYDCLGVSARLEEQEGNEIMYAVILTGGKQYKVIVGEEVFIEKLEGESGEAVTFDTVLAIGDDDGLKAGAAVKTANVAGEIVRQGKNKKIVIYKYKAKKGYRRKNGHRQPYTRVRITAINA